MDKAPLPCMKEAMGDGGEAPLADLILADEEAAAAGRPAQAN